MGGAPPARLANAFFIALKPWYEATIHVPYMYGAWEVREDYWTKV